MVHAFGKSIKIQVVPTMYERVTTKHYCLFSQEDDKEEPAFKPTPLGVGQSWPEPAKIL